MHSRKRDRCGAQAGFGCVLEVGADMGEIDERHEAGSKERKEAIGVVKRLGCAAAPMRRDVVGVEVVCSYGRILGCKSLD